MDTVQQELLSATQVAGVLGRTVNAINLAASRRDERLAPLPIKVGRRNYWTMESVKAWIAAKAGKAAEKQAQAQAAPRHRGRPKKGEERQSARISKPAKDGE